jgi:glycosyltransferase involved in cell wall biosynthesis
MSDLFISICIPTYKNVDYLQRLLQSIAIQTFKDYEIVITDNSPDNSVEQLVKALSDQLSIRYYRNDPPTNMGENFNLVMQKAGGKWIKMMHDDDWFADKNSLQLYADAAIQFPECNFIFSACNNFDLKTGKTEKHELNAGKRLLLESSFYNLYFDNVIGHPSTVMHKNIDVLYDSSFKWVIDIDFYIRFFEKYPNWHYIPETCVNIGIDASQFSNKYYKNPFVEIPEYLQLLKKLQVRAESNQYIFHALWLLVRKFRIKNLEEVPDVIFKIIKFQKNIPRLIIKQTPFSNALMKMCFKNIQGLNK